MTRYGTNMLFLDIDYSKIVWNSISVSYKLIITNGEKIEGAFNSLVSPSRLWLLWRRKLQKKGWMFFTKAPPEIADIRRLKVT